MPKYSSTWRSEVSENSNMESINAGDIIRT